MSRTSGILLLVLWVTLSPVLHAQSSSPNILLIVADYMGYSDIGPYGATDIRTPALDALAAQGVRFSNNYAASSICGPSRAALLSGFYPARAGLETNISRPGQGLHKTKSNLVRELKAAGYRCGMAGKWHLGSGSELSPTSHGFDSFLGFHTWTIGYHTHAMPNGRAGLYRDEELVEEEGYLTYLFSEEAIQFIEKDPDSPFFFYLAYNTGLPPYQGPDLPRSEWDRGWNVNEATREDYVAMVEAMDRGIGKVLKTLEKHELTENTLVVYTHDHGGRHLVRSDPLFHGFATLWEGGIRVPLIMRWPARLSGGLTVDQPTIAMDVTASLLAAANRDLDAIKLDGRNLMPLLEDRGGLSDRTLFWRLSTFRAARKGSWKLVVDRGTQMLFNLDRDISERHNAFSEYPYIASELRAELRAWERSFDR